MTRNKKIIITIIITIVVVSVWAPWLDNQSLHDKVFQERAKIDGTIDKYTGELICDYNVMWAPFGRWVASCEGGYYVTFWGKILWPNSEVSNTLPEDTSLRKTTKYGIFGDDTFDTIVRGFAVLNEEPAVNRENVYFEIIDYLDEGFKESIKKGIEEGNEVNIKSDEHFLFNLGCLKEGKIVEDAAGSPDYIDKKTQEAILRSTPQKPILIKISFEEHLGKGCFCCTLAERIRMVEGELENL